MMSLLEKAGLVSRVEDVSQEAGAQDTSHEAMATEPSNLGDTLPVAADAAALSPGLSLDQVYENAGVPASPYPAERLLRLLEGLKAMDDGLRRQTIQAIDAADDTWTIQDPISDATHKVRAMSEHAAALRAGVSASQAETEAQLGAIRARQEDALKTIRQQISDLEALMAREIARGAQECAALEADHQTRRHAAERDLEQLSRTSADMQALIHQFGLANGQ